MFLSGIGPLVAWSDETNSGVVELEHFPRVYVDLGSVLGSDSSFGLPLGVESGWLVQVLAATQVESDDYDLRATAWEIYRAPCGYNF